MIKFLPHDTIKRLIYSLFTRKSNFLIIVLVQATLLTACESPKEAYQEQFLAFGTLIQVKMSDVEPDLAQQVVKQIETDFKLLHRSWHPWNEGPLKRSNKLLASGVPFNSAPSSLSLIKRAKELSISSNGLFNPAIGNLIKLWGFHSSKPPKGPPPSKAEIQKILDQHPSMSDIIIDGISLQGKNKAVYLDFGGFAKGVAVDYAINRMKQMGVNNGIVNAGGDLRAIGKIGDRPWRVGIRNPRGEGILASVDVVDNECIFTSGDYERFFDYEGVRYFHILDPRNGYPARGTLSVTVFDDDAGRADAAATALFVAGPNEWFPIAKKMGVKGVMLVDSQGVIHMTPNLKDRIYFQQEPKPTVIFSQPLKNAAPI